MLQLGQFAAMLACSTAGGKRCLPHSCSCQASHVLWVLYAALWLCGQPLQELPEPSLSHAYASFLTIQTSTFLLLPQC